MAPLKLVHDADKLSEVEPISRGIEAELETLVLQPGENKTLLSFSFCRKDNYRLQLSLEASGFYRLYVGQEGQQHKQLGEFSTVEDLYVYVDNSLYEGVGAALGINDAAAKQVLDKALAALEVQNAVSAVIG